MCAVDATPRANTLGLRFTIVLHRQVASTASARDDCVGRHGCLVILRGVACHPDIKRASAKQHVSHMVTVEYAAHDGHMQ